jgi:putative membrane protein
VRGLIVRMLITAFALWIASAVVPGMQITSVGTLLAAAFLLGLVNAVVRPLVIILTLPLTILSLGIFLLIINGAMLGLVAALLDDFHLSGLLSAILGSLIVSITSWMASWYIGPQGKFEVIVTQRK